MYSTVVDSTHSQQLVSHALFSSFYSWGFCKHIHLGDVEHLFSLITLKDSQTND